MHSIQDHKLIGSLLLAAVALSALSAANMRQEPAAQEPEKAPIMLPKDSKALKAIAASEAVYVGAKKCKSCHNKDSMGNVYDKWEKMKHFKALERLQSKEALEAGKERGVEKPWEDSKCLKCHVTAYEAPAEKKHKRFPTDMGVQCETCHGPGSIHIKARLQAAKEGVKGEDSLLEIPAGEIVLPDEGLCRSCHNEDSPSYKEFKFGERLEKIRHLHPLRKEPRVKPPKPKKAEGEAEAEPTAEN